MKLGKKIGIIVLALAFVFACSFEGFAAYIESPWIYEVSGETIVISGYTGGDKRVIIPWTLAGMEIKKIKKNAFKGCGIEEVRVPDNSVAIEYQAFDSEPEISAYKLVDIKETEKEIQEAILKDKIHIVDPSDILDEAKENLGGEKPGGEDIGGENLGGEELGGEDVGGEDISGENLGGEEPGDSGNTGGQEQGNSGKTNGGKADGGSQNGGKTNGGKTNVGKTDGGKNNGGKADGGSGKTNGGNTNNTGGNSNTGSKSNEQKSIFEGLKELFSSKDDEATTNSDEVKVVEISAPDIGIPLKEIKPESKVASVEGNNELETFEEKDISPFEDESVALDISEESRKGLGIGGIIGICAGAAALIAAGVVVAVRFRKR